MFLSNSDLIAGEINLLYRSAIFIDIVIIFRSVCTSFEGIFYVISK